MHGCPEESIRATETIAEGKSRHSAGGDTLQEPAKHLRHVFLKTPSENVKGQLFGWPSLPLRVSIFLAGDRTDERFFDGLGVPGFHPCGLAELLI